MEPENPDLESSLRTLKHLREEAREQACLFRCREIFRWNELEQAWFELKKQLGGTPRKKSAEAMRLAESLQNGYSDFVNALQSRSLVWARHSSIKGAGKT